MSKTNAAIAEGQSLRYVLQARLVLDGSGYLSQLVQFNIAKFVNCATRLFAELDGFFCLSPNLQKLIWYGIQFVIFPPHSEFDPLFLRLLGSHLVQFLQF